MATEDLSIINPGYAMVQTAVESAGRTVAGVANRHVLEVTICDLPNHSNWMHNSLTLKQFSGQYLQPNHSITVEYIKQLSRCWTTTIGGVCGGGLGGQAPPPKR